MIDVGDLHRFGFRIGPIGQHPDSRDVSIFMNGVDVSRHDRSAYLPSYVGGLQAETDSLKRCLNFERYARRFASGDFSHIHNSLLHGDSTVFESVSDWEQVASFYRFMNLNEPNTDRLVAFLLPASDSTLCLTYQYAAGSKGQFPQLDLVDYVPGLLPYDLIQTLDTAIDILTSEK